jgi:adenosylmethionine-8-amino-7-oxononanoate aminotransferase
MSSVLHRDLRAALPMAVAGRGPYLVDADGRQYIDASGGAMVSSLGHGHPKVTEAIVAQVRSLEFAHSSFFTNRPAEALAARLIGLAPHGFSAGRAAFVGSGSEGMEVALKLARQYHVERGEPGRHIFIARRQSFHGNTLGALGVSGHPARRAIYEPLLARPPLVSPCHPYRNRLPGESDEAYTDRLADELRQAIAGAGEERVAAFLVEPIAGATLGSVPPVAGYLRKMRAVCDAAGVLLIADEVMCGMGRAGDWFVMAQEGVAPDLIVIAKGLAAGYQPIGAVLASEAICAAIAAGTGLLANGHTYMSHPVACAAALAVIETIQVEHLLDAVRARGADLAAALRERFGEHPHVGDIRGRGLFWSLEFVADRSDDAPFDPARKLAGRLRDAARDEGLICYPAPGTVDGRAGDHVTLAPPFIVTPGQIGEIVDKLDRSLAAVL